MLRIPAHIATAEALEAQGWAFDHEALFSNYRSAGSVSTMRSHGGREYRRVHVGKCVGHYKWQITLVYSRPVVKEA